MFCKIEDGIEGLIHSSELDWTNRNIKPSKVFLFLRKLNLKLLILIKIQKEFLIL